MINSMMLHLFKDNVELVNGSSKNVLAQALCVSTMVSFKYVLVFLNFLCFCFKSDKYYLMLLNFRRYLFSVNTIF